MSAAWSICWSGSECGLTGAGWKGLFAPGPAALPEVRPEVRSAKPAERQSAADERCTAMFGGSYKV